MNFEQLEDNLTLSELLELHSMAMEKHNRFARLIAAMAGVELEDTSGVESNIDRIPLSSDELNSNVVVKSGDDLVGLGYGLGYQTFESR